MVDSWTFQTEWFDVTQNGDYNYYTIDLSKLLNSHLKSLGIDSRYQVTLDTAVYRLKSTNAFYMQSETSGRLERIEILASTNSYLKFQFTRGYDHILSRWFVVFYVR